MHEGCEKLNYTLLSGIIYLSLCRDGISKLTYHLLQSSQDQEDGQPLVTVSPHGEIHTASYNGHAVILVTDHREELGLNQSVAVHVEVRESTCVRPLIVHLPAPPLSG